MAGAKKRLRKRAEVYRLRERDQEQKAHQRRVLSDSEVVTVPCTKRAYHNKQTAKLQLRELQSFRRERGHDSVEQSIYRCPACGWWHLTSQRKTENRRNLKPLTADA